MSTQQLHKALMLNSCLFPGAGYFLIGRKLKGLLVVFATLYFLIMPLVRFTHTMYELIMPLSRIDGLGMSIMNAAPLAWATHKYMIIWSLVGVVVLWVFSIVDVWYQLKRSKTTDGIRGSGYGEKH